MSIARTVALSASCADSGGCRRGGVGGVASLAGVADAADAADAAEAGDAGDAAEAAEAAEAADADDAPDAADAGFAAEAACAWEAADAGDSTDEAPAADDDASDAASAAGAVNREIGGTAASHTQVAIARVRQRGLLRRRVRSGSIMRSRTIGRPGRRTGRAARLSREPSMHPAHRVRRCRRLCAARPFAYATCPVQWRYKSRQIFHSTRPRQNRQR
nr:hypothetical protein [Burkholderia pseudomultivorans]